MLKMPNMSAQCLVWHAIYTHTKDSSRAQAGEHCLLVGYLTSQQHATVSQGRICTDNFTCCHIEVEFADQAFYLTQSQYTDTGPTSPSPDLIIPGAWQGIATGVPIFNSPAWLDPKNSRRKRDSNLGSSALEADEVVNR